MKILILNDSHDKGINPINRLDNYHQSLLLKLEETIQLSKDCDFVIHLGDVWDSSHVANTVIDDWLDRIEASKKTWYILPANHDMLNGKWENSNSSALAHSFRRSKWVQPLTELEFDDCYIKGYPYYFNCEEDIKEKGLIHQSKKKLTIACTHSLITVKPFLSQVLHVQTKDIKCNYNLVLCSHFHSSFDETINKTRFLNLGVYGRTSINEAKQSPSIAICDTQKQIIDVIPLKSAKRADIIFDLTKYNDLKKNEKTIEEFLESLNNVQWQGTDILSQIQMIGKEQKIDQKIIDYLLQKIGKLTNE